MFMFRMYSHIQYNGIDYYQADNQYYLTPNYSGKKVVVYLVDDSLNVRNKHSYQAEEYKGDEEHKYLYFDSAIFTRIDCLTNEEIKRYNVKNEDVEAAKKKLNKVNTDSDVKPNSK